MGASVGRVVARIYVLVIFALFSLAMVPERGFSETGATGSIMRCSEVANLSFVDVQFGNPITITSAVLVPGVVSSTPSASMPEFCRVTGTIYPFNNFVIYLPSAWNGRYYQVGTGAGAGVVFELSFPPAIQKGFLTAGTDTGHQGSGGLPWAFFDFSWAYSPPDGSNPLAEQKKIDHMYRSQHELAVFSKILAREYYGSRPKYSYWVGCSNGGREGLVEAQRYPEDFDGLVIGAPMIVPPLGVMQWNWNAKKALLGPGKIDPEKLPTLSEAVYKKCDGLDGLVDGYINDPRKCTFDPLKDLPRCAADQDNAACFTDDQMSVIHDIYGGPRDSSGKILYPGTAFGSEALTTQDDHHTSGWYGQIVGPLTTNAAVLIADNMFKYMAFNPPHSRPEAWDWTQFDFDYDPVRLEAIIPLWGGHNPDLGAAKLRGAKIIHWTGAADPTNSPYWSYNYYDEVLAAMGARETREFYRFFAVPGTFHCAGGTGCYNGDTNLWLGPLMGWVEKGIEPKRIIGARHDGSGKIIRTRPFCPYPEVARYLGRGSTDLAANFACATPIPVSVRIVPASLKLSPNSRFSATLTLPEGYGHVRFKTVICQGASQIGTGAFNGDGSFTAQFNVTDLKNIPEGVDEMPLTVTALFDNEQGDKYVFEGHQVVRVKGKSKTLKRSRKSGTTPFMP